MTVAILGAGVMGETLLSGLSARRPGAGGPAGRREAARARRRARASGTASSVVSNVDAAARPTPWCWSSSRRTWATCSTRSPRVVRPGQLVVSLAAGITTAFIEARLPDGSRSCGSCRTPRRSSTRAWPRSRRGSHCDEQHLAEAEAAAGLDRPGHARPGEAAGRGHRDQRLRPGVPLLRRRGDDRGRRAPRPAAHDGHRARRADRRRLGQAAARDRRAPRPCCASRSPRRAAPPPRRCASWRTTRSGRRSSPRWRRLATAPARWPKAWTRRG